MTSEKQISDRFWPSIVALMLFFFLQTGCWSYQAGHESAAFGVVDTNSGYFKVYAEIVNDSRGIYLTPMVIYPETAPYSTKDVSLGIKTWPCDNDGSVRLIKIDDIYFGAPSGSVILYQPESKCLKLDTTMQWSKASVQDEHALRKFVAEAVDSHTDFWKL